MLFALSLPSPLLCGARSLSSVPGMHRAPHLGPSWLHDDRPLMQDTLVVPRLFLLPMCHLGGCACVLSCLLCLRSAGVALLLQDANPLHFSTPDKEVSQSLTIRLEVEGVVSETTLSQLTLHPPNRPRLQTGVVGCDSIQRQQHLRQLAARPVVLLLSRRYCFPALSL